MKIKLDENIPVQLAGILATLGHEAEDIENWARCFVVVTDRKLRIRKPNV